jgi:hypothetical protein
MKRGKSVGNDEVSLITESEHPSQAHTSDRLTLLNGFVDTPRLKNMTRHYNSISIICHAVNHWHSAAHEIRGGNIFIARIQYFSICRYWYIVQVKFVRESTAELLAPLCLMTMYPIIKSRLINSGSLVTPYDNFCVSK